MPALDGSYGYTLIATASCPRAFTARSFTAECGTRRRLTTTRAQRKRQRARGILPSVHINMAATWSRAKFGGAASATSPTARSATGSLWCVARTRPLTAELAHTQTLHAPQNIAPMLIIHDRARSHARVTATRSLAFAPAASESVHGCGSSLDEGGVQLTDIGVAMKRERGVHSKGPGMLQSCARTIDVVEKLKANPKTMVRRNCSHQGRRMATLEIESHCLMGDDQYDISNANDTTLSNRSTYRYADGRCGTVWVRRYARKANATEGSVKGGGA
ncbi:hypothetical protein GGX14DRAFT_407309 [Mycena pura]|uniref:Uncharacterized protein n=1 Tax=Mycena pura TaxID=153505 RepID=A0AAD6XYV1_9AGAR|nr:hypothetical protein GGX14DRAFT_407309 [Mycena pura]